MASARLIVCVASLACLPTLGALQAVEPAAPEAVAPLAEFAKGQVGREAFGLYIAGQKTGWLVTDSHLATFDGRDVFEVVSEWRMVMRFLGAEESTELHSVTRHALEDEGKLFYAEETQREAQSEIKHVAERFGDGLRIRTTTGGETTERQVPLPRDTLAVQRDLEAWLSKPPRKGERFTLYEVTLGEDDIDQAMTIEYVESNSMVWGGVRIDAHRVLADMDGGKSEMLIGVDGRLLRGTMGHIMEIRAEEESVAKKLDGEPVDMLAASAIRIDQPLGDADDISQLALEISGLGDFQLPNTPRQQVEQLGAGRVRVVLSREPDELAGVPLSDAEREVNLRSTPSVQADAPNIRELATEIVGNASDPVEKAQLIVDWMGRNVRSSYAANASTATSVLEQRDGDCTEHALLFTALARAAGVPARQTGGVVYADDPSPLFAWHAWAEIHDGRGWISVDPMWRQVRVDPTHIQFSVDSESDAAWMNVLGAVKIEVRDVQRR